MARTGAAKRGGRTRAGVIGAVIVAGMAFAVYIALTAPKGLPLAEHSYAKAAFQDVGSIRVGDDVRVADVRVGRVDTIAIDHNTAVVTMQFDQPRTIYRDAHADIVGRSGLGQEYVNVDPGQPGSGALPGGDALPTSQTGSSTQLLDLVQQLDDASRKAAAAALRQVGGGAAGHAGDLHDFVAAAPTELPDIGTVSRSLAANNGRDLTAMLRSLDTLSGRFAGRQQQLNDLIAHLSPTMRALDADGGAALRASLDKAPATMQQLRQALAELQQPLRTTNDAMTKLAPVATDLAQATPDLRGLLREAPGPLGRLPGVAGDAQPALGSLTTVLHDARPVAPQVVQAIDSVSVPLNVLAPYAPEIAKWFSYATDALGNGDTAGHWLRFTIIPATDSLTGNLPLHDPLVNSDPYPNPGQAPGQHAPELPLPLPSLLTGGGR